MTKARRITGIVFACLGLSLAPGAAGAADWNDWTVSLGIEGRVLPTYPGSQDSMLRPIPLINVRRADLPERFTSARDGLTIDLVEQGALRAGITGKAEFPRWESDDHNLAGLGNVEWALEPGLFVEYWVAPWLRTRGELRQGIGGHYGQIGDLSADVVAPVAPRLTLSGGPRLTYATAKALEPYFGITAAQSAASGYPVYSPSGGLRSYGIGGMARYRLSPRWAMHAIAEYQRLARSAADSPLVTMHGSPNQMQIGLGLSYSFDVSVFR